MKLIDKSALVAEIERLKAIYSDDENIHHVAKYNILVDILSFLGTLEVKEAKEESVSEDLEIEIKHCIYEPFFDLDGVAIKGATKYLTVEDIADIARYFANWQKGQDQETIELAEDHAMFAGMEKMKEQLMAKAIDAEVKIDAGNYPYIPQMELYDYDKDIPLAKKGDRYKVILIKVDEL